ncbi:glycosyltransferase family 2 protein [Phormidium sp. CCY1219]|uniref:glycosyltransferase family 2 protein n=1 Tax=Phormidium sp. CCY1219 TaxID=2886104 RepID=UPI002D1EB6E6|nr:glycosyltransferase family 2 protein [Phormidium sp. CCY1219]MEB3829863.1 glycosyltransferase [Phormidium sp. CCY1219]
MKNIHPKSSPEIREFSSAPSGISVIVPTFGRVEMCERLFASLQKSRKAFFEPTEIIVIDDSSELEAQQIEALCVQYGVTYYFQRLGVAAKRNFGAKMAAYSLLLFIDSDCEATPNLLQEHWKLYCRNHTVVAGLGKTEFKGPESWIWQVVQLSPFLAAFELGNREGNQIWGPSNNLSCRQEMFQFLGGFDPTFPKNPGGEDVDFGYRLYQQGYWLTKNPQALVYHTTETWNDIGQVVRRLFHWGQGEFYVYERHDRYLYFDCPKGMGIVLLMLPIASVAIALTQHWQWLLLPLVFLLVNFCGRVILHVIYQRNLWREILKVCAAEILSLVYEVGLVSECIRHRWFVPLWYRPIVLPEEAIYLWNIQVIYSWVMFAQLVMGVAIVQLLVS